MKKAAIMLLILALACSALGPLAAAESAQTESPAAPTYDYNELRVGSPTALKGDFFTDLWGNATSDLDVRTLIHGYNLILWNGEEGMFAFNPTAVNGVVVQDSAEGDRTYYLSLYSDLYFSDGTPITAADYAFSFLLTMDPVMEQLGGKPLRREHLMGYEAFAQGKSRALAGVRMMGERRLSITVRHEYLPFFYELGLLDCLPYPRHVIAPECEIKDDGEGVYAAGGLDAATLQKTILDSAAGYRSHPSVCSGPYVLTSFDGTTAEFAVNPYFKGDQDGVKPVISRLVYTLADNDTMIGKLENAEFGLLNKVTQADSVQAGTRLVGGGQYAMSAYPRTGLTFISFNCEKPAVSSQRVRQAIAHCTDKDQLVQEYVGTFGLRVDGYYGMGQWMYQLLSGTIAYPVQEPEEETAAARKEYEDTVAEWEKLTLADIPVYALDVEGAVRLLVEDGWTLNRQGEPFRAGQDDVRCKRMGDALTPLSLTLAYPAGNRMAQSLEKHMIPHLRQAGIQLTLEAQDMAALLDMFYQRAERSADMLYLGTDFDVVFDPAAHFTAGEGESLTWNYTGAEDEELYRLAVDMRMTQPGDTLTYCQRWLRFQQRFAQLQVMIPVYSNVYFDFYPRVLHDYQVSEQVTWGQAVVKAYLSDAEDETNEKAGEDEMIFE